VSRVDRHTPRARLDRLSCEALAGHRHGRAARASPELIVSAAAGPVAEVAVDDRAGRRGGHLAAKLGELGAEGKVAGEEAKQDARQRLDELKAKLDAAQAKPEEPKKLGTRQWEEFPATIEGV